MPEVVSPQLQPAAATCLPTATARTARLISTPGCLPPGSQPHPASQKEVKRSQNCGNSPCKTLHTCSKHYLMQNTVVSGQDKRISSRILLSDVVIRRSFGPGSVPVPVVGRHSSTQSRASPGRRPGLQSPVPALGRRTGGQSQSPAALCVAWSPASSGICFASLLGRDPNR